MLEPEKQAANTAAFLGCIAIVAARLIGIPEKWLFLREVLLPGALIVLGDFFFLLGCWYYAKAKGFRGAVGLLVPIGFALLMVCWFYVGEGRRLLIWTGAILTVAGLLILAFLPDRHRWGT
jgi:hypothetical protein